MVYRGVELVEEGAGFGVPVVKYADKTFFSSKAAVFLEQQDAKETIIRKVFSLNVVSEKQLKGMFINNAVYRVFHRAFEVSYLNQKKSSSLFNYVMMLRKTLGIKTCFVEASSQGEITVTYHLEPGNIKINADVSSVEQKGCREIIFLNEQGADFFVNFQDGEGSHQDDSTVGGWSKVTSGRGCFSTVDFGLSFAMSQREGAQFFCGRERVQNRFAWAGMAYVLSPQTSAFDYEIKLG
ncbi:MAG: hypothetical protein NWE92_06360 [Candidatus Bathyarchaeota archaeon]|nr:hypothetical protein [Candidatus Bathyarchaeota archaeon]